MQYDVVAVHPTAHLLLTVRFADGVEGTVQLKPSHLYGVFAALNDPLVFQHVHCRNGFVEWPCDIDLAPDAMYESIRNNGSWVLE